MSEKEKMLAGEWYFANDPELVQDRKKCQEILSHCTTIQENPNLFGSFGNNNFINTGFKCDYGYNIHFGSRLEMNYNCVFLDTCPITVGNNVFIGPNVQVYTVNHPLDVPRRNKNLEIGKGVVIGDDVWIGGSAVLLPGVKIGRGSTIGAGSVVTKDVPANSLAVGNPAKVIRKLE
jgi:maltose O-acetyltransferase